ncbi:TetR/AcrR family transcriptional regulator [Streptomyces mayteni]
MFDEERALDAAMRVFWEKGYEATSTQDLCEATGLGRSSVYNTFHSKHHLFRRALAHYLDGMTETQLATLDDVESPGAERVRALLDAIVASEDGPGSLGCLGVNTTVEFAGRDADVAELLERDATRRLTALRDALAAGRRDGSVTSARAPDELARFVNAAIAGIRVSSQGGADQAALTAIADLTMDALTR